MSHQHTQEQKAHGRNSRHEHEKRDGKGKKAKSSGSFVVQPAKQRGLENILNTRPFDDPVRKKGFLFPNKLPTKWEFEQKKTEFIQHYEKNVEGRMNALRKNPRRNKLINECREAWLNAKKGGLTVNPDTIDRYTRLSQGLARLADVSQGKIPYSRPPMLQQRFAMQKAMTDSSLSVLPFSKQVDEEYLLSEESLSYPERDKAGGWYALDPSIDTVSLEQAKKMGSTEAGRWLADTVAEYAGDHSRAYCLGAVNEGLGRIRDASKKSCGAPILEPNHDYCARDSISDFMDDCKSGMFVRIKLPNDGNLDEAIRSCPSGTVVADTGGRWGHIFVVREDQDGVKRAYTDYKQGEDFTLHGNNADYYAFYPVGRGVR